MYAHIVVFSCQLMVDAVLEIMQKAVVPWSNVVEKLVQQYLKMDGPKYVYTVLTPIFFFLQNLKKHLFILAVSYHFFPTDIFPRQELLKESYQLMEIRKLLRGYGIRNFNLSNSTQIMVFWIWLIM